MDREERDSWKTRSSSARSTSESGTCRRAYSGPDPEWVCECGDETCFEKVTVPYGGLRAVRSHDDWFLIVPGHEKADVERIVDEHGGYVVVEKCEL